MDNNAAVPGSTSGNYRWIVCALLFFSVAINYVDRLVIGILKKPLSAELGWSDSDYGYIAAAFSFAYAFGYLIGGRWMDRFGIKWGLPTLVLLWSLAAMSHGLIGFISPSEQITIRYPWLSVAQGGLMILPLTMPMTVAGFMLARIGLGLAEGGNFPGAIKAVTEWFPVHERALATGWFNAGTNVGAILCPIAVPWLYQQVGWQATFYVTGALGIVWIAAWWLLYRIPAKDLHISANDLGQNGNPQADVEGTALSVREFSLLRSRAFWAIMLSSIFPAPAWGFFQFFIPDFLDRQFNLSLHETGWWTGAFFSLAAAGGIVGGWFPGALIKRGWSLNGARKLSLLTCALCVVPIVAVPFSGSVLLAVLIVGLAGSAHQGWAANMYSVVSDTIPRAAVSTVVGVGGFVGYFASGVINALTGLVLETTDSYVGVFAYFSGTYLLSFVAIQLLIPVIGRCDN